MVSLIDACKNQTRQEKIMSVNIGVVLDENLEKQFKDMADRLGFTKSHLARVLITAFVHGKTVLPDEYMHFSQEKDPESVELFGKW